MTAPTLHHLVCPDSQGSHRLAWWQWGAPDAAHVVVCVHGLSRQGRDFDVLARALINRAPDGLRVICPDMPGRGESDWLADPMHYQLPLYAADMLALIAHLDSARSIGTLDWVGTSMGGLIGMLVCGQPAPGLPVAVRRLENESVTHFHRAPRRHGLADGRRPAGRRAGLPLPAFVGAAGGRLSND